MNNTRIKKPTANRRRYRLSFSERFFKSTQKSTEAPIVNENDDKKTIQKRWVGCSMQGIVTNLLQRMKSASHSTISAPVYQGDGILVISARVVFRGDEIFVIPSRMYQARDTVSACGLVFSMLASRLFLLKFELGKSQSGRLILSPRYTFPTISSGVRHIYPKLTEAVAYCPRRPEKQASVYICGRLEGRKNTVCVRDSTVFFLELNLQTTGTNFQTFGSFCCASYAGTEFHNVLRLELILLDVSNVLDTANISRLPQYPCKYLP